LCKSIFWHIFPQCFWHTHEAKKINQTCKEQKEVCKK